MLYSSFPARCITPRLGGNALALAPRPPRYPPTYTHSSLVCRHPPPSTRITSPLSLHTREPVFCCRGGSLGWRPPAPSPPLECAERGQALLSATLHSQLPDIITISTGSLVEAWLEREILTALSAISNSVCRKISSWLGEGNSEIFPGPCCDAPWIWQTLNCNIHSYCQGCPM